METSTLITSICQTNLVFKLNESDGDDWLTHSNRPIAYGVNMKSKMHNSNYIQLQLYTTPAPLQKVKRYFKAIKGRITRKPNRDTGY